MRQIGKKILALVCVFAMLVGVVWMDDYKVAEASTTNYEGTIAEQWSLTAAQNIKTYDSITLDEDAAMTDYRLHIKMYIPQTVYESISGTALHIELCKEQADQYEYDFSRKDFVAGENEWILTWNEKSSSTANAYWGQSISYIRIYAGTAAQSLNGVIVREMKVVRMAEDKEWKVFSEKVMGNTGNTGALALDSPITFGSDDAEKNLMVCVELNVSSDWWSTYGSRDGGNNMYIELLPTSTTDSQEYQVQIPVTQAGVNTLKILLSDVTKTKSPSVSNTLNYYRIYMNSGGTSMSGITITSMYIIDTAPHVEEHTSSVWTLVDETIASSGIFDKQNIGFTSSVSKTSMALILSLDIPETVYNNITEHSSWRVKIAHDNDKDGDATFSPTSTTSGILNITKAGLNEFVLYGYDTNLSTGKAINRCRVWHNEGQTNLTGVKVTLKVVDLNGEYIKAGSTPTELGADVSHVPDGYIFAGWYTDEACTSATALESDASGTVYAKYVREGVLNVKAQKTTYMYSEANKEYVVCEDYTLPSGAANYIVQDVNLDLTSVDTDNLSLYVELEVPDSVVNHASYDCTKWRLKFSNENEKYDGWELTFKFDDMNITSSGVYSYTFDSAALVSDNNFTFDKTIAQWRIFCNSAAVDLTGVKINTMKFVYTAPDSVEVGAIRFITSVDSLQYQQVGFDITINGNTLSKYSNKVYEELYAVCASDGDTITYKPSDIDPIGICFSTYTVDKIPTDGFDTEITVQSYWITQDGAKVLGESKTYTLNGMATE